MGILNTIKEIVLDVAYVIKIIIYEMTKILFVEKPLDEQAKRIEDEIKIAELKNKLRKARGE